MPSDLLFELLSVLVGSAAAQMFLIRRFIRDL
jgi:hypothetical protein